MILKRLIAYDYPEISVTTEDLDNKNNWWLQTLPFYIENVGGDTISFHVEYATLLLDGAEIANTKKTPDTYIYQTRTVLFAIKPVEQAAIITPANNVIVLDFAFVYDTVPSSGTRTSHKIISYKVQWPNGTDKKPQFTPTLIEETEK